MTDTLIETLNITDALTELLTAKGRKRRGTMNALSKLQLEAPPVRNDLLPELKLIKLPIASIRSKERKLRKHDEGQIREIEQSIVTFGFCVPLLLGKNYEVIDGEARLETAKLAGLTQLPCIDMGHLANTEQRSLCLAANRLSEKAQWHIDALKSEMEELIVLDAPITMVGFSADEIDQIILDEHANGLEEGPLEPEAKSEPRAVLGQVYQLGPHRIICGDSTKPESYQALFGADPEVMARLVFTDMPYNVPIGGHVSGGDHPEFAMASGEMSDEEFLAFNKAWIGASLAHLGDGGLLGTYIDWRGLNIVHSAATSHSLMQLNLIVWGKTNAGMGSLNRSHHELLPLYEKGSASHINNVKLGKNGRYRSNLWTYPGASSLGSDARRGLQDHPTVKPTDMLEDAIIDISNRDDIVIDPFLGSGSTLIAAHKVGRICYGIEIDPRYVDLIIQRFEEVSGQRAKLLVEE